jgi:hypothetical protein
MPRPEGPAEKDREKSRETTTRKKLIANRLAFYALLLILLIGFAFFALLASMQ